MDPIKYLDQLDEAREKATPGEWMADSHELYVNLGAALDGIPGDWIGETCRVDDPRSDADAALIVAAVNNLPLLTAALRAVLELIDPENGMATGNGYDSTRLFSDQQIRAAITEAFGGAA